jgi:hypothetical protein
LRWFLASLPALGLSFAGWMALGWALARIGLRVQDRVRLVALALPLGLAAHVLAANAVGHVVALSLAARALPWIEIAVAAIALAVRPARTTPPLPAVDRLPLVAVAVIGSLALGADLYLDSREVWQDDDGHASMAHLMAAGQFPLRFQCNPDLTASYAYGGDLLAATLMVVAGLRPWEAMDVVRPAVLAGALMLAFVAGWTVSRRVASGLLAVGLLLTAGPMVFVLAPLARFSGAETSLWGLLTRAGRQVLESPWSLAVVTPGFITPTYAHVQRSLSWVFAPFLLLLFLVASEAVSSPRRRAVALGLLIAAAALLHVAVLVILVPGILARWTIELWARRSVKAPPSEGLGGAGAAAVVGGLGLAVLQGGMLTDAFVDRLHGVRSAATTLTWAFPQLPSCRLQTITAGCAILSALNLGVVPFLLPWLARRLWSGPANGTRRMLLLGALVAYGVPLCFRYWYGDWNLQRLNAYATWTLAVLLAPYLGEAFARAGWLRRMGLGFLVVLASLSGLVTAAMVVTGRGLRDSLSQDFSPLPAPLDLAMMGRTGDLPRDARFFDPLGCLTTTATRPGYLFGRYVLASRDRARFRDPLPEFEAVLQNPQRDSLLRSRFTHLYLDAAWFEGLSDAGRAALEAGPVSVVGAAAQGRDFRAVLRVCRPDEACPGFVPARDVPR